MPQKIADIECPNCGRQAEVRQEQRGKALYIKCDHDDCRADIRARGQAAQNKLREKVGLSALEEKPRAPAEPVQIETEKNDSGEFVAVEASPASEPKKDIEASTDKKSKAPIIAAAGLAFGGAVVFIIKRLRA